MVFYQVLFTSIIPLLLPEKARTHEVAGSMESIIESKIRSFERHLFYGGALVVILFYSVISLLEQAKAWALQQPQGIFWVLMFFSILGIASASGLAFIFLRRGKGKAKTEGNIVPKAKNIFLPFLQGFREGIGQTREHVPKWRELRQA